MKLKDHGHHDNRAILALDEFVSFDDAIGKGLNLTSDEDTMVSGLKFKFLKFQNNICKLTKDCGDR